MSALLIGAVLDSAFSILHTKLRANTVEFARRKFGRVITRYSPWLCFAPLVDEMDTRLIHFKPPFHGSIVTDPGDLAIIAAFLDSGGRAAITDLPGNDYRVWLPSANGISSHLEGAIAVIEASDPVMRARYDEMVDFVVPLGGGRNRGFSSHLIRGAIFRALPHDGDIYDVAIDLIHEVGHQVLMVWQSIDPILTSDHAAPVYSLIRKIDRPAIQSFHAAVALAYMRYLELALPNDPGMQAAGARRGATYTTTLSHSLGLAIEVIRKECAFTEVGEVKLSEMERLI